MDHLKSFVTTITVISVFMVAIELILPENKLKKYQEFVLSLIVLSVILTPVIKIFTGIKMNENIEFEVYKNIENSTEVFSESETNTSFIIKRLEENCKKILEENFPKNKYKVEINGKVDLDTFNIAFDDIYIKVIEESDDSKISKIEKIQIEDEIKEELIDTKFNEIQEFLAKELNVNKKIVKVIKG